MDSRSQYGDAANAVKEINLLLRFFKAVQLESAALSKKRIDRPTLHYNGWGESLGNFPLIPGMTFCGISPLESYVLVNTRIWLWRGKLDSFGIFWLL